MNTTRGTANQFVPRLFSARGFTLPELIGVLVILGVLIGVAAPKLLTSGFDENVFYQQSLSALRYAQSAAVAFQRTVCVQLTATSVTLTYATVYGSSACDANLPSPSGGTAAYQVLAKGSATFTAFPASFSYDRIGRPSAGQTISVSNGAQIHVEPESGYAY